MKMTDVHIFIFCVNYVILERVDNAYRKCQYKVHIKKSKLRVILRGEIYGQNWVMWKKNLGEI